jgi:molecular chaperone DnaJ
LSDPQKRSQFDQFGTAEVPPGFGGFSGQGFPGGFSADAFGDLGDIFGSFFGGGGSTRGRRPKGEDIGVDVTLTFKEAVFGVTKEVTLRKSNTCQRCGGQGAEPGSKLKTCTTCKGDGYVTHVQRTMLGSMQVRANCDTCHGRGEMPETICTECQGEGTVRGQKTLRVDIPAGVESGMQIRVRGEGESLGSLGEPGDLYLQLRVTPDKQFIRDGSTIYVHKKIGFTQAALGDTVAVATVDGSVDLKIPAGTQSGDELRLRNKGVPTNRGRGDQIVRIQVATPTKLDKKSRQLLEELALREE